LLADCYANSAYEWGLPTIREVKANTRLMAAAPDLYRIVKFLHDWFEENKWSESPYPGTLMSDKAEQFADAADDGETFAVAIMAAIDKAEGK
jgi:hypothetical protein